MSTAPQTWIPAPTAAMTEGEAKLIGLELRARLRGEVKLFEPMSRHTTFRIGGPADIFVEPADTDDLTAAIAFGEEKGLPTKVVGNGSNLLVGDRGIRGLVVRLGRGLSKTTWLEEGVQAEAGATLAGLVRNSAEMSLSGLESTVGIPGTLGGALATNAGTDSGWIGDLVGSATVMNAEGKLCEWTAAQFAYRYRYSSLRAARATVVSARLKLQPAPREEIEAKIDRLRAKRAARQPLRARSAGSVFKNPRGVAAGKVLDRAGAKGMRVGGAEISRSHANFFVNRGQATADEMRELIEKAHALAQRRYGVDLELEIELVGE